MAEERTTGNVDAHPADKPRKMTFSVPADLARRFSIHAAMLDMDKTEFFCELIRTHCRRFRVHDRGKDYGATEGSGAA